MEHLRCVVERITYQNTENGYTVLKCAVKNYNDLVTVVGTMPDTHVGSVLSLDGMWKMDAKYGRQFSVQKFEETLPATVYGIEKYLGSGLVKGVGPKFAKRIVEKFGEDTLDIIEETPDELLKVPGIGKVRVDRIKTSWQEQKEIKNIMLFLQGHEVSTSHATKIFKTYGSESIAIVNQDVVNTIVQYCKTNLPRYYHVDPLQDIQVLTPMQRGECGAINLNQVLQEAMNPSKIFLRRGGTQYRLNDKVMQIRNDYEKEVFNGDIGTITKVDMEERELTVLFETREVVYDVTELDELMLAYAVTIHKSQGSEYPIVVMPFTMSHFVMLQRNLLYTGVTRAKKILVLVGEKKAIYYAIRNETTTRRNTCLARRLQSDSEESKEAFSHL